MESDASWEVKYQLIFSPEISRKVHRLISLDYYNPDTSYQEDVTAWWDAFCDALGEY
jgi:hypothetical protein